jgi:hypothetical protein
MVSGAKSKVKQKQGKSKFSKVKGTKRSVSCGRGKMYDMKKKKCVPMKQGEKFDQDVSGMIGYGYGGALGSLMGAPFAGALAGRQIGRKYSKLRMSGQGKRRK